MFEKISETLGIETQMQTYDQYPVEATNTGLNADANSLEQAEEDFAYARSKIRDAIEKTSDLLEEMADVAKASEDHRVYDVANTIASNIASMADSLVKLHKETLKAQAKQTPSAVTNNNTVIVESTDEVIKMLKAKRLLDQQKED